MFNKVKKKINALIDNNNLLEEANAKLADKIIELEKEIDYIKEYANKLLEENEMYREYKQERDDIQLAYEAKCKQLEKEKGCANEYEERYLDILSKYQKIQELYNNEIYEYNELLKDANSFSRNFISKMYHVNEMNLQRKDK